MPKTIKHDQKADFLLEKGIELLWSKGYNATSVNDIVKAAEIPKGSFYFYFNSKEDFAVKALEKYFNEQIPPTLEIINDTRFSPRERLINFYKYRCAMVKEELACKMGCMGCNLANEMAEHNDAIRNVIVTKTDMMKEHITRVFEEAQELGEINKSLNARDVVEFIEDAGKGALTTMKEQQSPYPIDNYFNMIESILLK